MLELVEGAGSMAGGVGLNGLIGLLELFNAGLEPLIADVLTLAFEVLVVVVFRAAVLFCAATVEFVEFTGAVVFVVFVTFVTFVAFVALVAFVVFVVL